MPLIVPDATAVSFSFDKAGVLVAAEPGLNLVEGSNINLAVLDNAGSNRVDVTVSAVTTDYTTTVVASNPASYWRFNETSGSAAADVNALINGTIVGGTTYVTEVTASAPASWWRFNETSGTTAADVEAAYAGTIVGGP